MNVAKRLLLCAAVFVALAGTAGAAEETAQTTPAATGPSDVWWGNRGVSFGNYIKSGEVVIPPKKEKTARPDFAPIYFDLDKANVKPDGIRIAEKVAKWMKKHPEARVVIEGHCCDLASLDYNMGLGQRRADAVKAFLVKQGVDASRIQTISYGEQRPAVTDRAHRDRNRRAMCVIAPKQ